MLVQSIAAHTATLTSLLEQQANARERRLHWHVLLKKHSHITATDPELVGGVELLFGCLRRVKLPIIVRKILLENKRVWYTSIFGDVKKLKMNNNPEVPPPFSLDSPQSTKQVCPLAAGAPAQNP